MTSTMRFDRWENPAATQSVTFDQLVGGTGLVPIAAPTVLLTPPGGSATANTNGKISFTSVTSISLNNVFTSDFANYRIIISGGLRASAATTTLCFRLRANGTDASGTNYYGHGFYQIGTATSGASQWDTGNNLHPISNLATTGLNATLIDIFSPYANAETVMFDTNSGWSGSPIWSQHATYHSLTNFYDGFTLFTNSAAVITGTVQVFGYNE